MHVRYIELREFRNYQRAELELAPGMIVLHGRNGAGKSNLLEGIGVAALGEAVRAREAGELIRAGEEHAFVGAWFGVKGGEVRVEVGLGRRGQKQIKIAGVVKRRADLIGLAPVVYFSADDIGVVKGEPSGRRRLLDQGLCAASRQYYFHLGRYRKGLEQRNRLLKEVKNGTQRATGLEGWDRALARYGAKVMVERCGFIEALGRAAGEAHGRISGEGREFVMAYRPTVAPPGAQPAEAGGKKAAGLEEQMANALVEAWGKGREADIGYGATLLGPHRDEVELVLDGRPVRGFGSQGEQRTCALAMRMGLAATMREMTGEMPAVLLDDVLSELDERHREGVFAAAGEAEQVMITCCDVEDVPAAVRGRAEVVEVRDGTIAGWQRAGG